MLRRILFLAVVFCVASATWASAIPGQTEAQLAQWGKHVSVLHGFKPTMDEETAGTNYLANVVIDGESGYFSSEPENGVVHKEYVGFSDVDNVAKQPKLIADVVNAIYGPEYATDFRTATRVPHNGRVAVWKGERMSYFAFASAVFFARNADFAALMKNVRQCDALDCSGD